MGGGDPSCIAPQSNQDNKAMDIEHEVVATPTPAPAALATAPTPAPTAPPVSKNINEENKVEVEGINEGQEAIRKGKKSYIWTHFKQLPFTETNGEYKARCNHCRKEYQCHPTRHGTNSMNKHLKNSHKWIFTKEGKHQTLHGYMPKVGEEGEASKTFKVNGYSLEDCRKAMAEFVILDEMPFKVVEGIGFCRMINRFEPRFTVPSRMTMSRDCFQLYLDEKKKLKAWLTKSCVRVYLTTDCWTSNQNLSYMSLTAHFVDEEWKLQKRILNFCMIEDHKGETIEREIEKCLREWGIEKVFTITVDNATSNDGTIAYLKRKLAARGGLVCEK